MQSSLTRHFKIFHVKEKILNRNCRRQAIANKREGCQNIIMSKAPHRFVAEMSATH